MPTLFLLFCKVVSGDDDLPKKDDIGEKRRKHELQVLARAGVESEDGAGYDIDAAESNEDVEMDEDDETEDSEDEFYKQVKQQRAAKLAAKAEIHSRCVTAISYRPRSWFFYV